MKTKQSVLQLLFSFSICSSCIPMYAQQSRVDSVIALLNKSNIAKGPDSVTFDAALKLISTAVLTDAQISQIEKAADQSIKGRDEELYYVVKFIILRRLSNSNMYKAINYGQLNVEELEHSKLVNAKSIKIFFISRLARSYWNSDKRTEGFQYYAEKLNEYKKTNDSLGISICYLAMGRFYSSLGLYEPAVYHMKKSLSYIDSTIIIPHRFFNIFGDWGKLYWISNSSILTDFYLQMRDYEKAISQGKMALNEAFNYYKSREEGLEYTFNARHLAMAGLLTNQLDSVDYYLNIAENSIKNTGIASGSLPYLLQLRSLYNTKRGAFKEADSLLQQCWKLVNQYQFGVIETAGYIEPDYYLALLRVEQKDYKGAIALLLKDIERVKVARTSVLRDYELLAELYEKTGDDTKAKKAYQSFIRLQDSLLADQSKFSTTSFETEQLINENEIAISKLENENMLSAQSRNFSLGIAALLLILAGSIYYRFQSKKKANKVLEKTLTELKATQSQLIQSEKMASLGQLTAGIAHEIQNPLNFINNFSEVNKELLVELKDEIIKGNLDEVNAIAADVISNEEKINHHGKRADGIVKGMLQHSRSSSGQRELTDINALADEYLRLAYHGLMAKDKSSNAVLETDFDETIPPLHVNPQDIGRVILNLITNAFYAVDEKKTLRQDQGDKNYEPTVSVSTKKVNNKIEISVSDNGNGIPDAIKGKIFQPFFTTKPTGQGTGLGLSLTYDIVKAHGGELKVETKPGEGTTFIFEIPFA